MQASFGFGWRPLAAASMVVCLGACGGGGDGGEAAAAAADRSTTRAIQQAPKGGGMQIAANGVLVNSHPQRGQVTVTSSLGAYIVYAALSGGGGTPADTVVTLNNAQLIHAPGLANGFFSIDPLAPQPKLNKNNIVHITASSASTGVSRILDLPCPALVNETSTPPAKTSLRGVTSIDFFWGDLSGVAGILPGGTLSTTLLSYDLASGRTGGPGSGGAVNSLATGITLDVPATTATGYLATTSYQGIYQLDGNTGGVCSRLQSYVYTNA